MLRPEPEAAFAEATQNPLFFPSHLVLVTRFLRISITFVSAAKLVGADRAQARCVTNGLCLVQTLDTH